MRRTGAERSPFRPVPPSRLPPVTHDDYTAPRFYPTRPSPRKLLFAGALLGGSAVACGAFGAHWVEGFVGATYSDPALAAKRLANWHTAADYHLVHALAVLACGLLGMSAPRPGGGPPGQPRRPPGRVLPGPRHAGLQRQSVRPGVDRRAAAGGRHPGRRGPVAARLGPAGVGRVPGAAAGLAGRARTGLTGLTGLAGLTGPAPFTPARRGPLGTRGGGPACGVPPAAATGPRRPRAGTRAARRTPRRGRSPGRP